MSSDWVDTSDAVEEEEEEEGYAIGENWEWDGGLREREASRSLGGCLGRTEATDIVRERAGEGWDWEGVRSLYPPSLVLVFQLPAQTRGTQI